MKTLYININNEEIQSNEELVVLPHRLDIDMLVHIGEEIANGCRIEDERKLITDFNISGNEDEYKQFIKQMDELKFILFGNEYKGSFEFKLPAKYLDWLKYSSEWNDIYSKNFSSGKSSIIIDLKEFYEASVKNLQKEILRKLERDDLYLEINVVVFNDDVVTRKSPIVCAIKGIYKGIGLKAYKEWLEEQKEDEEVRPTYSNKSLLLATKKVFNSNKYEFICEYTRDLCVYNPISKDFILQGRYHNIGFLQDNIEGGEILLESSYHMEWDRLFADGTITKGLKSDDYYSITHRETEKKKEDTALEYFEKIHPEFAEVESLGFSKSQNAYIFIGWFQNNINNNDYNGGQIWSGNEKMLFETSNNVVPIKVTSEDLLLAVIPNPDKENNSTYGIIDFSGKTVFQFTNIIELDADKDMGYFVFGDRWCNDYYDFRTGKLYKYLVGDYLIRKSPNDPTNQYIDIIDKYTGNVLHTHIGASGNHVTKHNDGFYSVWDMNIIYSTDDECWTFDSNKLFLFNKVCSFHLDENEQLYSNFVSNIYEKFDSTIYNAYISEERVITGVLNNGNWEYIRIRDYKGNIIANIPSYESLIVKHEYKYNKAIAIKTEGYRKIVFYITDIGEIIEIPNSEILGNPREIDCFFVSNNRVVINDQSDSTSEDLWWNGKLLDIEGNILFQCDGWIIKLSDKYLKYYSVGSGYGVINIDGEMVLNAEYDNVSILE